MHSERDSGRRWAHIAVPRERLNRTIDRVKSALKGNLMFGKQQLEEKLRLLEIVKKEGRRPDNAAMKRLFTPEEQKEIDDYLKR